MSVSMWAYLPGECDGGGCPGDCDLCSRPKYREDEEKSMTDYISLQAAIEAVAKYEMNIARIDDPEALQDIGSWEKVYEYVLKTIPTADVVEVVRCKDCKHYRIWEMKCDRLHAKPFADDHYCGFGERAEE